MKHTKGEWKSVFTLSKERGVRNEGGFICFLTKPSRYSGQDERYERELDEAKANAKLIAAAPELLEALQAMDNLDKLEHLSDEWWKQAGICDKLRNKAIKKVTQ